MSIYKSIEDDTSSVSWTVKSQTFFFTDIFYRNQDLKGTGRTLWNPFSGVKRLGTERVGIVSLS